MSEIKKAFKNPVLQFTLGTGAIVIIGIAILDYVMQPEMIDILVEAHGLVFDIILFGIIISIYDIITRNKEEKIKKEEEKSQQIKRYLEEIDDYRHWDSDEAKYRIIGNVKRLNKLGVSKIDLNKCYLSGSELVGLNLKDAILGQAGIGNSHIVRCSLINANLETALVDNELIFSDFSEANFNHAPIFKVESIGCKFRGSNFESSTFEECIFKNFHLSQVPKDNKVEFKKLIFETSYINKEDIVDGIIYSDFTSAIFKWAKIKAVDFEENIFKETDFENATLKNVKFVKSEIIDSNFNFSTLEDVDFSSSKITNTTFDDIEVNNVIFNINHKKILNKSKIKGYETIKFK